MILKSLSSLIILLIICVIIISYDIIVLDISNYYDNTPCLLRIMESSIVENNNKSNKTNSSYITSMTLGVAALFYFLSSHISLFLIPK
jgi:hypothetical protein